MKLPLDMRLNLLSIFAYAMEDNDAGSFWKDEYSLKDKEILIEAVIGTAVEAVKLDKTLTRE